jgi:hypothetical protein
MASGGNAGTGSGGDAGSGGSLSFNIAGASDNGGSTGAGTAQNIGTLRIDPQNATLKVAPGAVATQTFRALATMKGSTTEVDITSRTVFYVPDNYLVGGFPADGGPTFSTNLPTKAGDPPQRGGVVTVQAQAANSDDPITSATTTLNVVLTGDVIPASGSPDATPSIPKNPAALFSGTADVTRAPELVYPNNGTLLPPNLGTLEVHFKPGSLKNTLYQIEFSSATSDVAFYTRCASNVALFEAASCNFLLDETTYAYVAASNQGSGPVQLIVRGSDEAGKFGESAHFTVEFAQNRVDGAIYYWAASKPPRIMRMDFSSQSNLEEFLNPSDFKNDDSSLNTACVGCHILSRDGSKLAASIGNSYDGRLAYLNDLSKPRTDPSWLTVNPASASGPAQANRILSGSFAPDGTRWVEVAPENDAAPDTTLFFNDGTTGLRVLAESLILPFIPSSPDWSPDGKMIAMTAIPQGQDDQTISFQQGGIAAIQKSAAGWSTPITVVANASGKNRYNPNFFPDSSLLLFSESSATGTAGNGYADPSAKTWVVEPRQNATPVFLANVANPGVADLEDTGTRGLKDGNLMDTFPRSTPFKTDHRGETLFWFTVSSQRRAGLRKVFLNPSAVGDPSTQQLLWMFAVDPAKVHAGKDGSYPGFFLPFQDLTSSNHMAQWTEKIVSANPPPPAPTPPPPVPPPPPPPPK